MSSCPRCAKPTTKWTRGTCHACYVTRLRRGDILKIPVRPVPNEKVCRKCKVFKNLEDFTKNSACRDGRGPWCLSCFSRYVSARSAKNQEFLNAAKNKPCADCQESFPPYCMDFDHVKGDKSAHVSGLLTCSPQRLLAEIQKCEVVCACCHRVRSAISRKETGRKRLQEFHTRLNELKSSPCADCRRQFLPVAMDFDHVRGTKFRMVSTMVNYSWERVLNEISKCDLVCACCHRQRTQTGKAVKAAA